MERYEEEQLVSLTVMESEPLARLAAQRLEAEGILCVVKPVGVGPGGWGMAANLPHALFVRASNQLEARQLLEFIPAEVLEREGLGMGPRRGKSTIVLAVLAIIALAVFLAAVDSLFAWLFR